MQTTAHGVHHVQHAIGSAIAAIRQPLIKFFDALAVGVIAGAVFAVAVVSLVLAVLS